MGMPASPSAAGRRVVKSGYPEHIVPPRIFGTADIRQVEARLGAHPLHAAASALGFGLVASDGLMGAVADVLTHLLGGVGNRMAGLLGVIGDRVSDFPGGVRDAVADLAGGLRDAVAGALRIFLDGSPETLIGGLSARGMSQAECKQERRQTR